MFRRFRKALKSMLRQLRRRRHSAAARRIAASCGADLRVNNPSRFTRFCRFGNNCNFNGMTVLGGGEVTFGDNFHSGENCRIITQNHNFDHGTAIPYDRTKIKKKIVICDNVWLGDSVIIVGNVTIGESAAILQSSYATATWNTTAGSRPKESSCEKRRIQNGQYGRRVRLRGCAVACGI